MAERHEEQVQRILYALSAEETKRRILDDLIDDVGHVFNDSTTVTIFPNGECHVVTEFANTLTKGQQ